MSQRIDVKKMIHTIFFTPFVIRIYGLMPK